MPEETINQRGALMDIQIRLNQIKRNKYLINVLKNEILELDSKVKSVKALSYDSKIGVNTSHDNSTERMIYSFLNKKEIKFRFMESLEQENEELLNLVLNLENSNQSKVLYSKYFEGKTVKEIAYEMGRSREWVSRTKKKGIQKLVKKA